MAQDDQDTQGWAGRTVNGRDGAKLGTLTEVYPDRAGGGNVRWGTVRSRFGRHRLVPLHGASTDGGTTVQVPVDRQTLKAAPTASAGAPDAETETALQHHYTGRGVLADTRARQHDRFGGTKVGAAFFGWLVAVGLSVLLSGAAAGIAALLGVRVDMATAEVGTTGLTGAIAVLAVLLIAYFAGGYVAGRLARFDGARNGLTCWLIGLVVTVVAAILATVAGSRYDVLGAVQLPARVSVEQLTVGGVVAIVVILLATLLAAVLGGKAGERFHNRVDRVATEAP